MRGFVLALILALTPLPNLPLIPSGSEIRVVSPDLLSVFVVWEVDSRQMILRGQAPVQVGRDVRVMFRIDGGFRPPYSGTTTASGDVLLAVDGDRVSLNELLTRTYRLELPRGRVLPQVR
ncbi:MAG: hypothetical protein SFU83_05505 [Meiothermus sp.]|nr:hypothetical protein [Meiothermus sp.]